MKLYKSKLLASSLLGLGSLGLMVAAPASAEEQRHCIDQACHYLSLPSLEALLPQGSNIDGQTDAGGAPDTVAKTYGTWGFDVSGMDTSVKPGDDFFDYANGTAVKNLVIPADRSSYGSFNALRELSQNRLKVLVETIGTKTTLNDDEFKIATLYKDFNNVAERNRLDYSPLKGHLAAIAKIKTHSEMAAYMGKTTKLLGSSLMNVGVLPDFKNPGINVLVIGSSGYSLPDRDYYLDEKFKEKKAKYEAYVTQILDMIGYKEPAKTAHDIVEMETKMAEASWTKIEQRDPVKQYNPTDLAKLSAYAPGFDWKAYMTEAGVIGSKTMILGDNTAVQKIAKIYADTPIETLKAWETFKTVDGGASLLSERFETANWTFWSHELSGTPAQQPLWKRAINLVEGNMGEVLGKTYVATYFPPESKAKMVALVADLRTALKSRIEGLTWMSDATKTKALDKLAHFTVKIGYPDVWRDYSKLKLKSNDLVGNIERSAAFQWDIQLAKIDKPVDRSEWGMTPQTVNAYYNPLMNEIVFPAAILQPPFFDPKADPAINYGGIGGVIGHEMTHGFDDQGRQFAADGSLSDWWQADDAAKFSKQAERLGAQYDSYEPIPGAKIQGGLTMGENIADYGGVTLGYEAYKLSLKGQAAPVIDGFTGEQRVFLGWAQVWRSKYRDDAVRQQVVTDPHSPAHFRVTGTVRNVDAWYNAFGIKEGDKYYIKPEDRVKIW